MSVADEPSRSISEGWGVSATRFSSSASSESGAPGRPWIR